MSDMSKIIEKQERVLKRLENELQEALVPARVRGKDDEIPSALLTVLYTEVGSGLDEVIGEYTFLPAEEGDGASFFTSMLTITDNLPQDNLDELRKAVARLNLYLPQGSVGIDIDDKRLGYKFGVPVPLDIDENALFELINMYVTTGYIQVDRYVDMLLQIAAGEATAEELLSDYED